MCLVSKKLDRVRHHDCESRSLHKETMTLDGVQTQVSKGGRKTVKTHTGWAGFKAGIASLTRFTFSYFDKLEKLTIFIDAELGGCRHG